MMIKNAVIAILISSILSSCSPPEGLDGASNTFSTVQKFQMSDGAYATCIAGTRDENGNNIKVSQTLVLVDLTDKLLPNQIQYVRDNWIANVGWKSRGDSFGLARMTKQPPEEMKVVNICAPDPVDKDNSQINSGNVKTFIKTYSNIFDSLLLANGKGADNSLLIESIRQIFTNARYKFSSENGPRHFILVSDLYQNSSEISFFQCNPKEKNCSFESVRKSKSAWFDSASLGLTKDDSVTIYHLSSKCRVDLKAKDWWVSYFESEGAGKVKVISELGTNQCATKPIEVIRKIPVEVIKEVQVPVEVIKEVEVEVIKEVEVEVIKEVEVPVEVIKKIPVQIIKEERVCGGPGTAGPGPFNKDIFCD